MQFDRVSSGSELSDSTSVTSSESEQEYFDKQGRKIPDYYFDFTDSDAESDTDRADRDEAKSKEQKLHEKLVSLLDSCKSTNMTQDWVNSLSQIDQIEKVAADYMQRSSPNPRDIPEDVKYEMELIIDGLDEFLGKKDKDGSDDEGDNDAPENKVKNVHVLRKLRKKAVDVLADFEKGIALGVKKSEMEAAKDVDSSDVDPVVRLMVSITESVNNRKRFLQEYKALSNRAAGLGLPHIIVALKGYYVQIALESGNTDLCVKPRVWKDALETLKELYHVIKSDKSVRITTKGERYEKVLDDKTTNWVLKNSKTYTDKKSAYKFLFNFDKPKNPFVTGGGVVGLYKTLFAEMTRMCQHLDQDYFTCLKLEHSILSLGYEMIKSLGKREVAVVAQCMIASLSGRTQKVHDSINECMKSTRPLNVPELWNLCVAGLKASALKLTFLQYCFFLSVHGPANTCLDTLYAELSEDRYDILTTNADGKGIRLTLNNNASVEQSIMFNRILVGLGMQALASGRPKDCKNILSATISDPAWRTLIGQKLPFVSRDDKNKTALMVSLFKPIMLPKHLHINTELVDLAYLFGVAIAPSHSTLFEKDQVFEKFIRTNRNVVKGSPQNPREYLFNMYSCMKAGDSKAALESLAALPFWKELPNGEAALEACRVLVREGALREFFIQNCSHFSRLPVSYMEERFGLTKDAVVRVVTAAVNDDRRSAVTALWLENEDSILIQKSIDPTLHELVNTLESKLQDVGKPQDKRRY